MRKAITAIPLVVSVLLTPVFCVDSKIATVHGRGDTPAMLLFLYQGTTLVVP